MHRWLVSFLCVLLAPSCTEVELAEVSADLDTAPGLAQTLDAVFTELHATGEFQGSVLVTRGTQTLYQRSFCCSTFFGQAHTVDTRQSVNSVTKGFVGAALMLLADDANPIFTRQSFDAPITTWLTQYRGDRKWERVTVQQILNHESSIPDTIEHPLVAWNFFWDVPMTTQAILDHVHSLPMRTATPGTAYEYIQTNYLIGARLVELISGMSFSAFLRQKIFVPAGMSRTTDGVWPDDRATGKIITSYQNGIAKTTYGDVYPMTYLSGAGSMFSTVSDLNKWSRALFDETILSREQQDFMLENHDTTGPGAYPGYGYGLGFINSSYRGHALHTNGGAGTNGFAGNIHRFVDEDVTLIIQTNLYATNLPVTVPYRRSMGQKDCRILNAVIDFAIEGNPTTSAQCATGQ